MRCGAWIAHRAARPWHREAGGVMDIYADGEIVDYHVYITVVGGVGKVS